MKIKIIICMLVVNNWYCHSQQLSQKIGTNPTIIDPSAVVEIESTTKGFLPPRMTFSQRLGIASPAVGLIIYCTNCGDNGELEIFNGTAWTNMIGATTAIPTAKVPISGRSLIFLAHNLGADRTADPLTPSWKLNGAYFQWGKKPTDTNGDVYKTKVNDGPAGFKAAPTGPSDAESNYYSITSWSTTVAANTAWNIGSEATPLKSSFDPCPSGYRVPTQTEWASVLVWNTFVNTGTLLTGGSTVYTSGKSIAGIIFLPAAGYHSSGGATGGERGVGGYYWSSTIKVGDAQNRVYNLRFVASQIASNNLDPRNEGYSVRCVKE